LKEAYFQTGALTLVGAKDKVDAAAMCSLASSWLSDEAVDLEAAFYASQLLSVAQ
jgi:hypothetical protein